MKEAKERQDFYEELTATVLEALDRGVVPWQRPWDAAKCGTSLAPFNPVTGRVYKGTNFLKLALDPRTYITGDPRFCTFKNCIDNGWHVRKGEHGTSLIFYEPRTKEEKDNEGGPTSRFFAVRKAFTVFHAGQIDGIPPYAAPKVDAQAPFEKPQEVVAILSKSGAVIREVGEQAYYTPVTDHIGLPPLSAFAGSPQWAATALHELSHWTGHASRLNRDHAGKFGSEKYAKEELVAELASFFTCSTLGLPVDSQNHTAYLAHWAKHLREDKKAISHAAAAAYRATDLVLSFHPKHGSAPVATYGAIISPRPDAGPPAASP